MDTQDLRIRRVAIDTWRENVAYLHRDCPVVRAAGFQALAKVMVRANGGTLSAVLNVVDDERIVAPCELGLSEDAFARLQVPEGHAAAIAPAEPAPSIPALHRKIAGERLGREDLHAIIRDIAAARYSKIELAAFVVATNGHDLERDEILHLTEAMIAAGRRLDWGAVRGGPVVDKHCIGGIPGNRTSMLVVPIVTAHGMLCPKTSSRAITSPAGTADTMEVLAEVELPLERLQQIVRATNGCLAWGGTAELSPADDILHLQLDVMVTDGSQPIGRGIGPVLEARDVMAVLRNEPGAPADLRDKALRLAGRMIEFDPDVRGGDGWRIARDILDSGRALAQMEDLIEAQGRRARPPALGELTHEVLAAAGGRVGAIDNLRLARIARLAGAPQVPGAGVDLLKKVGDAVRAGEPLYRLHAQYPADLGFARELAEADGGYRLDPA